MVTDREEFRDSPGNSIERIRELAAGRHVRYMTSRVMQDVDNLGYTIDDVCACLASLESGHFRRSIRYAGRKYWLDEYLMQWHGSSGQLDELYIKLKLGNNCIWIDLASFHRER